MQQAKVRVFANFVKDLATLSKCKERKVAAVITDKDMMQIYSIGLNGGAKGLVDCMCAIQGKYGCIHAEINALVKCRSDAHGKVMFVTLSPCISCAAAIINAPGSFSAVYYLEEWKNTEGIKLLKQAGIKVIKINDYQEVVDTRVGYVETP